MQKNILLINPWIYDFAAHNFGTKPIGLLRIASHLRHTHNVSLIDCMSGCSKSKKESGFSKFRKEKQEKPEIIKNIERPYFRYGIPVDSFKEKLSKIEKPNAIYVSSGMTYWYPGVQFTIKILKALFPNTPITLGGIYASLCPEHAEKTSGANYIWKGRYLRDNIREEMPSYDLLEEKDILPVWTSKGCPYTCSYCASRVLDSRYQQRDIVTVFEEIMYCKKKFGTSTFIFYDDALFYKARTGIKKLLRMLLATGEKFRFYTPNGLHARFIDEELCFLLREVGFEDLRLSLETSDRNIQRFTGGKVGNKHIKRSILLLKEAGFSKKDIGIYILMGAPWLPIEKTKEDVLFVNSLGAKAVLASYSPIPGTLDYFALLENGVLEENLDPLWHNKAIFYEKLRPGILNEMQLLRRFASKINK